MQALVRRIAPQVDRLPVRLALHLPGGARLGASDPEVTLAFSRWSSLALFAAGRMGALASDVVEGRVTLEGAMRPVMQAVACLLPSRPEDRAHVRWRGALAGLRSRLVHTRARDAQQVRFHYDVSDEFYALWLDPRRVYSCAYFRTGDAADPQAGLARAQEAKLDLICRKLMLRPGERFLDIGAGWGALLVWAAQHYGVHAHGITLSRNQHAHVTRRVRDLGLAGRVRVDLMDYRDLAPSSPYDKIASVGMFEHVGRARMPAYFAQVARLLRPGGLALNHGITAGRTAPGQVDPGLSDFIERYIFPGGELLPAWEVLRHLAAAGLETVDVENLRPHYARTLWAWSDRLESQLAQGRRVLAESLGPSHAARVLRAYRLYLAGCAMAFERGWLSLHQVVVARPTGDVAHGALAGAQSDYPFNRDHLHAKA